MIMNAITVKLSSGKSILVPTYKCKKGENGVGILITEDSYPVNKADRIGGVDRRNCDPYKQDGGLQRGDTASVTHYMQEIAKSILHISLMSCIIHSSDMGL